MKIRVCMLSLMGLLAVPSFAEEAMSLDGSQWIWHPAFRGRQQPVTFRTTLDLPQGATVERGGLVFSCDNGAVIKVNGQEFARQESGEDDWRQPTVVWIGTGAVLKSGANVITADCTNNEDNGMAGLCATFDVKLADGNHIVLKTDESRWEVSADGKTYVKAQSLGTHGCHPWGKVADRVLPPKNMREYPYAPGFLSQWISAAEAKPVDANHRRRQMSAPGTSWFMTEQVNAKDVARATWSVAGLGIFEAYVNGRRIGGEDALKPGCTHPAKTKVFFTYDVTLALAKEKGAVNTFAAEVSAGWWRDQILAYPGRLSAFRSELEVEYTDGSKAVFGTNPQDWKGAVGGPVLRAAVFDGEIYDARVKAPEAADYKPAVRNTEFNGEMVATEGAEIRRRFDKALRPTDAYCWKNVTGAKEGAFGTVVKDRVFKSGDRLTVRPGETLVVDFGQNAAAVPHFTMSAKEGTVLTCLPGETVNDGIGERSRGNDGPGGSVYRANLRIAGESMRCQYTFGTDPVADYFPRFTFFGYRYLSITATDEVTLDVESVPVSSIARELELGSIETGVADVNRLISNVYWGQLSNYLSVPTDCPQRNERLGWTADTQVFVEAGAYNADTRRFFHKWMRDERDSQDSRGGFPGVAPRAQYGNEPMRFGWADAGVIVPYQVWKQFGDTAIVDENWDAMAKYVDRCAETKYQREAIRGECGDFQWADWLSYEGVKWEDRFHYWDYLGACYWLWDARMMAQMARATKRDAAKYDRMADEAKAFVVKTFFDEQDRFRFGPLNGMQTPALFALKLGLVEGLAKERMIADLRKNFKDHGDCLQTGFLGTSILMDTLTENGMCDIAYSLLLQHKNPSWLYSVDQGATTIWERWNSYTRETGFGDVGMNSFNHYAYGAVLAWIYKTAAGIASDPEAPGFRRIVMAPQPDRRLGHVKASYRSAAGLITSAWWYEGDEWVWEFSVPEGATACVTLPGEKASVEYPAGRYSVRRTLH